MINIQAEAERLHALGFAVHWLREKSKVPYFGGWTKGPRTPIKDLKTSVFGGWMLVVKIAACAAGALFSVFKQGFGPLGIGAGVALGIHFFDTYLGDGADGALI